VQSTRGPAALTVGLVLDDSLDRPDGVQQHVLTLGAWLTAQGHTVHYLATSTTRTDLPHLHDVGRALSVRFNGNRLSTPLPASAARLRTVLAAARCDVVHVAMPYSPLMAGRVVARATPTTAVVGTFHIVPASPLVAVGARLLGLVQRRRLRRFDRVIAVSEPARGFARSAFGLDTVVLPNPVDVARFADAAAADDAGRSDAAAGDAGAAAPVTVLFLGRLVERKGAAELLEAVAILHRDGLARTPFRVVLGGRGPLAADLTRYADEHGIGHLVELVGFVPEADKPALLAAADVVALPSSGGESFGISVVEALAAARGVVLAGDNPGYREVIGPLTDQLVDVRRPELFAHQLARYLDDPALRAAARTRQRERAWVFDVAAVGPAVVEVYRAALARRCDAGPPAR